MEDDEFAAKPSSGKELLSTWRIDVLRSGKISSGEENQQRQENGGEIMQTCGENYQRRVRVSSGGIASREINQRLIMMK